MTAIASSTSPSLTSPSLTSLAHQLKLDQQRQNADREQAFDTSARADQDLAQTPQLAIQVSQLQLTLPAFGQLGSATLPPKKGAEAIRPTSPGAAADFYA